MIRGFNLNTGKTAMFSLKKVLNKEYKINGIILQQSNIIKDIAIIVDKSLNYNKRISTKIHEAQNNGIYYQIYLQNLLMLICISNCLSGFA